jgi:hypothetical protein
MRRERIIIVVATAFAAVLLASAASAATPRQIYSDLVQHGKLTQQYSAADLARFRQDATLQGYGSPSVLPVVGGVTLTPTNNGAAPAAHGVAGAQKTVAKPYTCSMAKAAVARGTATPAQTRLAASCSHTAPARVAAGTLPFTGMELSLVVALGLALVAGGFLLRRTTRASDTQP